MKRVPKTMTKLVTFLKNPVPKFVSLVDAGANKTPFRAVKSAKGAEMKTLEGIVADGHDIARIAFSKAAYADTAAVEGWLAGGGYEGYEIEDAGETFVVANKSIEFDGEPQAVEMEGLTVYVGAVKQAQATEDKQVSVKSDDEIEVAEKAVSAEPNVPKAVEWLGKAIVLHGKHLDGTEPTSDASQKKMMTQMVKAYEFLGADSKDLGEGHEMKSAGDVAKSYWTISQVLDSVRDLRNAIDEQRWEDEYRETDGSISAELKEHLVAISETLNRMISAEAASVAGESTEKNSEPAAHAAAPDAAETQAAETVEKTASPETELKDLIGSLAQTVSGLVESVKAVSERLDAKEAAEAETVAKAAEAAAAVRQAPSRKSGEIDEIAAPTETARKVSYLDQLAAKSII